MKVKLTLSQVQNLINEGKLPYRFLEDNDPIDPETPENMDEPGDENPEKPEMSDDFDELIEKIKGSSIIDFLKQMPKNAKGKIGYVFYTAPVAVNKFYIDDDGLKKPNPMVGKLFKNTAYKFRFDHSYKRAVEIKNEKTGDDYEIGARQSSYSDVEGYNMLLSGKSGLYFPIVLENPKTDQSSNYMILNDTGGYDIVSKDEIKKYLKPVSGSTYVDYRSLIVQRVYRINASTRTFNNPEFPYEYLGPKNLF